MDSILTIPYTFLSPVPQTHTLRIIPWWSSRRGKKIYLYPVPVHFHNNRFQVCRTFLLQNCKLCSTYSRQMLFFMYAQDKSGNVGLTCFPGEDFIKSFKTFLSKYQKTVNWETYDEVLSENSISFFSKFNTKKQAFEFSSFTLSPCKEPEQHTEPLDECFSTGGSRWTTSFYMQ